MHRLGPESFEALRLTWEANKSPFGKTAWHLVDKDCFLGHKRKEPRGMLGISGREDSPKPVGGCCGQNLTASMQLGFQPCEAEVQSEDSFGKFQLSRFQEA